MNQRDRNLRLLIVLGIGAIAISVVIQVAIPYLQQQRLQKIDELRINDLNSLNSVIEATIATSTITLGHANTVYISIPSNNQTCDDLGLPRLPEGWQYHCVPVSTLLNVDGTGWLPLDLNGLSGAQAIAELPIDPINSTSTSDYYAFVTGGEISVTVPTRQDSPKKITINGKVYTYTPPPIDQDARTPHYVLVGSVASNRYLSEQARDNSNNDPTRYEVGNDKKLWANAQGLIAYWPLNEGTKLTLNDKVGGQILVLNNESQWVLNNGCPLSKCIGFDGKGQDIEFRTPYDFTKNAVGSYSFWFKLSSAIPVQNTTIFNPGTTRLDVNLEGQTGSLFVWFTDSSQQGTLVYKSAPEQYTDNEWHDLSVVKDRSDIEVFIDGSLVADVEPDGPSNALFTQNELENGDATIDDPSRIQPVFLLNDLRFYNLALSSQDIENEYATLKP